MDVGKLSEALREIRDAQPDEQPVLTGTLLRKLTMTIPDVRDAHVHLEGYLADFPAHFAANPREDEVVAQEILDFVRAAHRPVHGVVSAALAKRMCLPEMAGIKVTFLAARDDCGAYAVAVRSTETGLLLMERIHRHPSIGEEGIIPESDAEPPPPAPL